MRGGGFYRIRKYLEAPEDMPDHLIWFKWESYATWLSGAALLMAVYWAGVELCLLDPAKTSIAIWQGILISAGSLTIGWICYDFLCKSRLGETPTVLMLLLFAILVAMSWSYDQIFTGRAALLHLGCFHRDDHDSERVLRHHAQSAHVVNDFQECRTPDPKYGRIAKLRSTHKNYLTLPVVFLMLRNHYPPTFAIDHSGIIASLVFLTGITIRHCFNTMHATGSGPHWTWAATVVLFLIIAWLSTAPMLDSHKEAEARRLSPCEQRFAEAGEFGEAYGVVLGNCSMCHVREPVWDGIRWPPKGVVLETECDVARHARAIFLQADVSRAMPPPNPIATMSDDNRATIVTWFRQGSGG